MVTVQLDEDLAKAIRADDEPIDATVRELVVFELYRRGTLSRGRAAELLGTSLLDFLRRASRLGIPYLDMTPEEWEQERRLVDSRWQG